MKGNTVLLWGVLLGIGMIGLLFLSYGYDATWRLWDIPTKTPVFVDALAITAGAESYAEGYDPLVSSPRDPLKRKMNYPRIWHLISFLGIDQRFTVFLGSLFAVLFVAGIFLLMPREIDRSTAFVFLGVLFSPAVLLGIERGNSDLCIFFLLAGAVFLLNIRSTPLYLAGIAALALAFMLKLYPLFGFIAILRQKHRVVATGAILLLIAAVYVVFTRDDLALIREATPRGIYLSYGMDIVPMYIAKEYGQTAGKAASMLAWGAVLVCMLFCLWRLHTWSRQRSALDCSGQKGLDAFRVGCGIYLGTFLLGNNWDYRLMFLLFAIPELVCYAQSQIRTIAWTAKIVIICIILSTWYLKINQLLGRHALKYFSIDELANWALFFGLSYLLVYSAPGWIMEHIRNMSLFSGALPENKGGMGN